MNIFKRHFSKQDVFSVGLVCIFYVNIWAIINLLNQVPAWLLRMDTADLVGTLSYILTVALIESLAFTLVILLLILPIPRRFLKGGGLAHATMLATLASGWAMGLHLANAPILIWGRNQFLLAGGVFALMAAALYFLTERFGWAQKFWAWLPPRLSTLAAIYLLLDLIAVAIAVTRSI